MIAAPTLVDPAVARSRDQHRDGGIQWSVEFTADGTHLVLPDLCTDIIWTDERPVIGSRTRHRLQLPAISGSCAHGLRLPAAATEVRLDAGWEGWALSNPFDRDERAHQLGLAVQLGVVRWRIDPERVTLLTLLDQPEAAIPTVAASMGLSQRTLRRRCLDWYGSSASDLSQVLRLWRFARETRVSSLSASAQVAGFVDHQHAARSVRACFGLRPSDVAHWAANAS